MKSEDLEKPEAKTPQEVEVYVILENEKVKEEKKLECWLRRIFFNKFENSVENYLIKYK